MRFEGFAYLFAVVGVALGMAGMLAAEGLEGVHVLLPVGGALAVLGVGAITVLIGLTEPPEDAGVEH